VRIANKCIGDGERPFLIAEVAQAHDGSLGTAHAYIEAIAEAGADAVKFQTHIAAAESTTRENFRVRVFPQDETRYDYWKRMEFSIDQWEGLAKHAKDRGLIFLSTPFSLMAIDLLERVGVPAWKVGSGDITNLPLLDRVAGSGKPIILSSGMSPWKDLDVAVGIMRDHRTEFGMLQCTSDYPCAPAKIGLNIIAEIKQRYGCTSGLSDHSGTVFASLAAAALGAEIIEVHVVFSRRCFGPDVSASVTIEELGELARGLEFVHTVTTECVDKDIEALSRADLRVLFGRSIVAARNLSAGCRIESSDLAFKKPGGGIPPGEIDRLIGKRLSKSLLPNQEIMEDDFENDE
jgi:N,N'-diacetyllegionaminate synthase